MLSAYPFQSKEPLEADTEKQKICTRSATITMKQIAVCGIGLQRLKTRALELILRANSSATKAIGQRANHESQMMFFPCI